MINEKNEPFPYRTLISVHNSLCIILFCIILLTRKTLLTISFRGNSVIHFKICSILYRSQRYMPQVLQKSVLRVLILTTMYKGISSMFKFLLCCVWESALYVRSNSYSCYTVYRNKLYMFHFPLHCL